MGGPWEQFQSAAKSDASPWEEFQNVETLTSAALRRNSLDVSENNLAAFAKDGGSNTIGDASRSAAAAANTFNAGREKSAPIDAKTQFDNMGASPTETVITNEKPWTPGQPELQPDGLVDRAGMLFDRGTAGIDAGARRVGSALSEWDANNPLPWTSQEHIDQSRATAEQLRTGAQVAEAAAGRHIAGEQSWADLWAHPTLGKLGQFTAEGIVTTIPATAQAVLAFPLASLSNAGSIAQNRADNNQTGDATVGDVIKVLPFAIASSFLDRYGVENILNAEGKTAAARMFKAGFGEGATEYTQGALEYGGASIGTKAGFDPAEANQQGLQGAVIGFGMGAGGHAIVEGAGVHRDGTPARTPGEQAAINRDAALATLPGNPLDGAAPRRVPPKGMRENAIIGAINLSPDDMSSALPDGQIAAGRAGLADAAASGEADKILAANGAPKTGARVTVDMPNGAAMIGTIADVFEANGGEAGTEHGVRIMLDQGGSFDELFSTLRDAGVSISEVAPDPGADAVSEQVKSARPAGGPAATPPGGDRDPEQSVLPANGRVTSPFGHRDSPMAGASTEHNGVDIAVPVGSPVRAPAGGRVIAVGSDAKSGNFVRIDHGNGVITGYAHLGGANVKVGEQVTAGQEFALSGNSGNSTGPHLHWTTRVNGQPVDPMTHDFGQAMAAADVPPEVAALAPTGDGTREAPIEVTHGDHLAPIADIVADPTDAQKEPGNYRKAHIKVHGLDIAIENPKGSTRSGTDPNGETWSVSMPDHYGYVKRTKGADGDQVDVYVGPNPEHGRVFVVDQADANTGKFDEHKAMIGYTSQDEALAAYRAAFSDGRGDERIGNVVDMDIEQFKTWLNGDTTKPAADTAPVMDTGRIRGQVQAPVASDGTVDAITFLAANGGIRDDQGHNLRAGRNLQKFVPRHGALIRPSGMTIDDAGSALHEAGYFGPPDFTSRPTTDAVLQFIENAQRTKMFAPELQAAKMEADRQTKGKSEDEARAELADIVQSKGFDLTDHEFEMALNRMAAGEEAEDAIVSMLDEVTRTELRTIANEAGDDSYVPGFDAEADGKLAVRPDEALAGGEGRAAVTGAQGERGAAGEERAQGPSLEEGSLGLDAAQAPKEGMTERDRAVIAAHQQQGMARKDFQVGMGDQAGGMFANERDQTDLLDAPAPKQPTGLRVMVNYVGADGLTDAERGGPLSKDASKATVTEQPSGKSVLIKGATEAELAAIAQAIPNAKPMPHKDGVVYSKKYVDQINAALAKPAESAPAAPEPKATDHISDEVFKRIWNDKKFKDAMKAMGDLPHRESEVASSMAQGWYDGNSFKIEKLREEVARLVENAKAQNMQPFGFNPRQGYVEAFYAAVTGDSKQVRQIESGKIMGVEQALREIETFEDQPAAAPIEAPKAAIPDGITVSDTRMTTKQEKAENGGDFTAVASHQSPFASARGFGNTTSEAGQNAIDRLLRMGRKNVEPAPAPEPAATPAYGAENKVFTADAAEKARALLKSKFNQLNSGFDPELAQAGLTLVGFHIEAGARSFIEAARKVAGDLGVSPADLKGHLRSWYNSARTWMEDNGHDVRGMDDDAAVKVDMSRIDQWGAAKAEEAATVATEPKADVSLPELFRDRLLAGDRFKSITDARKVVETATGEKIEPGTARAKEVDEAIEAGVVLAARKIAAKAGAPLDTYRKLVDLYQAQPALNVRTSTSVEQQAYSTPVPLAFLASQRAGIGQETTVYEPSAGNGALLIDARATYVTANELNPARAAALRTIYRGATITEQDATKFTPKGTFDAIIANPPFGVVRDEADQPRTFDLGGGYETREIDHAISLEALKSMKDGGKAVLIVGSINKLAQSDDARSDAYNGKAKREFYLRLYSEYNVTDHFTVAGEMYARQGAGWPVDVIVIEGRGKSALRVPAADVPKQFSSWEALESKLGTGTETATGPIRAADENAAVAGARPEAGDGGRAGSSGSVATDRQSEQRPNEQPSGLRDGSADGEPGSARPVQPVGGNDVAADQGNQPVRADRPAPVAKVAAAEGENSLQVSYSPASTAKSLGTLIPVNMQTSTRKALDNLQERVGAVDKYVADKIGIDPKKVGDILAAEQIDAVALGIDNMERGAGFIIGDQTGIGKGRVVASIIRYALREGRRPIFVTEKPNLYGDMYRDLNDVGVPEMLGRPVNILMTNAAETVPLDDAGTATLKTPAAAKHNAYLRDVANGANHPHDVIFTTYSQMQSYNGAITERQMALRSLAPGSILIFDESHNAGGQGPGKEKPAREGVIPGPNRAELARELAGLAHGVFFSSATYAKRPDVMDLYASTDMKLAVPNIAKLGEAISKGGVPMQQVVASNLAEAGQYVRRERSFDGISYMTPIVPIDRVAYSGFTTALQAIQRFSEQHVKTAVKGIDRDLKADGKSISGDNSVGGAGASSVGFSSVMHNLIDQMLLAVKADETAANAIAAIKAGKKPVITVANTMASFLDAYVEEHDIKPGDPIDLDFRDLLARYLERTRWITMKKPFSREPAERHRLTDGELGPMGVAAFSASKTLIEGLSIGNLPISPIDHIRSKLIQAGYKVGEITGRSAMIEYGAKGSATFKRRPGSESNISGRRKAIAGFNGGQIDAFILNQAGATGLSLHASKTFKDQRPRHMIIAQAEKNIDTHMQMLGRIHRSGQVVLPSYDQMTADVPAEKRPTAVLAKKMASLSANTTGSRDSAMSASDTPDFMNAYGDEVIARLMEEDPDLHDALDKPLKETERNDTDGSFDRVDATRKVTGRIVLLPLDQQEAFYDRFLQEYKDFLAQKEAAGESALDAKTLPIDARTISREQVVAPTRQDTPFGEGVYVEKVNAKRLGRPFTVEHVLETVAKNLDTNLESDLAPMEQLRSLARTGRQWAADFANGPWQAFRDYRRAIEDVIEDDARLARTIGRHEENAANFNQIIRAVYPGLPVRLQTDTAAIYGVVTGIEKKGEAKNPLALGTFRVTFALADSSKQITLPMSQLVIGQPVEGKVSIKPAEKIGAMDILDAFKSMQNEAREDRTIITGNILAGFDHVHGRGQIVNFVDNNGDIRQGVLMPRDYDYDQSRKSQPVEFRNSAQVVDWINRGQIATALGVTVKVDGREVIVQTPSSKSTGGTYFLNRRVRQAVGGDFVKSGNYMRANAPLSELTNIVQTLRDVGASFTATDNLELAQQIVSGGGTRYSIEPRTTMKAKADTADVAKLREMLTARLATLGLGDKVLLDMVEKITNRDGSLAGGSYRNWVVTIAHGVARDPSFVLNHEAIHALRDMGLFKDAEWTALAKAAKADKALMADIRARYAKLYGDRPFAEADMVEEAVADMFGMWAKGQYDFNRTPNKGWVQKLFDRIKAFFGAVDKATQDAGITDAEKVFNAIEGGQIGQRTTRADGESAVKFSIEPGAAHEFDNPETEARFRDAAKGIGSGESLISRVWTSLQRVGYGFSRHWIDLPNVPKYSDLMQQLRKLEAAPQSAKERAIRMLTDLVKDLNHADMDLFTRKVILDDLMWEASQDHKLAFGLTPDTLLTEKAKVDAIVAGNEKVHAAVLKRKVVNRMVANDLVAAGVLEAERLKNPAYFRHQVLEYARAEMAAASAKGIGSKLRSPKWAKRMGSSLDINANLLEAEFDWLNKALTDIPVARSIEWIKKSEHNILPRLQREARENNKQHIDALLDQARELLATNATGPAANKAISLIETEKGFRVAIAMGLDGVRKVLANGDIKNLPRNLQRSADALMANTRDSTDTPFPLLSWIMDNDEAGAGAAGMVFKAIAQRRVWMEVTLGDKYIDPQDTKGLVTALAGDGYTTWQPDEGKLLFSVKTIPEHVIGDMLKTIVAKPGALAADMLPALEKARNAVAVGGDRYAMILPTEVAATLNELRRKDIEGVFEHLVQVPQAAWKRWILFNPRRFIKYNLNNLSGDLDAVIAGNPRLLRRTPDAAMELARVMRGKAAPSARYQEAVDRGVFDSGLSVREIPELNSLSQFAHITSASRPLAGKVVDLTIGKYWRGVNQGSQWRENVFRYAAYLDYVDRLEAGEKMSKVGYGASVPKMLDAISDPKDKAAALARDLLGDYGMISTYGQSIRKYMMPFWSWMEINTKRYKRLTFNAFDKGLVNGFATGTALGTMAGARTTATLLLRMGIFYGMVSLFNHLFHEDEEKKLSEQQRNQLHLILWSDEKGEITTLRIQGAASDAISWFGWTDTVQAIDDYEKGYGSLLGVAGAPFKATANKLGTSLTPVLTLPLEAVTGKKLWPDIFNPRANRDKVRNALSAFSLDNEYDAIRGKPSRGYGRSWAETVLYRRDPGEIAYDEARGLAYDWLRNVKEQEGGDSKGKRTEAYRDYRQALRFGDQDAANKALDELIELGTTQGQLDGMLKRAAPLGPIAKKDRQEFIDSLSDSEYEKLVTADEWYRETFK